MEFKEWIENVQLRVWLDDERDPEDPMIQQKYEAQPGMVWAKTAAEAIHLLQMKNVSFISLDHDLGAPSAGTGYEVAVWIESHAYAGTLPRLRWAVHSANIVGKRRIAQALMKAEEFWDQHEKQTATRENPQGTAQG